jgi:streptogramin lyase
MNEQHITNEDQNVNLPVLQPKKGYGILLTSLVAIFGLLILGRYILMNYEKSKIETNKNIGWSTYIKNVYVGDLAVDKNGKVWAVYYYDKGLENRLHAEDGTTVDPPLDKGDYLWKLAIDSQDQKWVGTARGVVEMQDLQGKWTIYTPENPNVVDHLAIDGEGRAWVKNYMGLGVIDPSQKRTTYTTPDPVGDFFVDKQGRVWVENGNGLRVLDSNGEWITYSSKGGPPMDFDQKGQIWMSLGWEEGIGMLDQKGNLTTYPLTYGLVSENVLPDIARITANAIVVDNKDQIWVGTTNHGLFMFNSSTGWTTFNEQNFGLPADSSTALVVDGQGRVWVGTGGGIYIINTNEVSAPMRPSLASTLILPSITLGVALIIGVIIAFMLSSMPSPKTVILHFALGFLGWFVINSIYWGVLIVMMRKFFGPGSGEAILILLPCVLAQLPLSGIVVLLLWTRFKKREIAFGAFWAIVVNSLGLFLFSSSQLLWDTFQMTPFFGLVIDLLQK